MQYRGNHPHSNDDDLHVALMSSGLNVPISDALLSILIKCMIVWFEVRGSLKLASRRALCINVYPRRRPRHLSSAKHRDVSVCLRLHPAIHFIFSPKDEAPRQMHSDEKDVDVRACPCERMFHAQVCARQRLNTFTLVARPKTAPRRQGLPLRACVTRTSSNSSHPSSNPGGE